MADISQIEVDGIIYDIHDRTIDDKFLPLTGGTLTGPLTVRSKVNQGNNTTASGNYSHAEGNNTTASGNYSHAEGEYTSAKGQAQTVIGKYNVEDTTSALIIGNGTATNKRSNAIKVDFSGNTEIAGNIYFPSSKSIFQKDSSGFAYPAIIDNGTNLWIGSEKTATQHHKGETFISTGYNGTTGNQTIKVCVPNATNTGGTSYSVYHSGYKPTPAAIGALSLTDGGTVSGTTTFTDDIIHTGHRLFQKATNIDRDGTAPSSDTWSDAEITFQDKNAKRIGLINIQQRATDGAIAMWITPRTENTSGSEIGSGIKMTVEKDGSQSISIGGSSTTYTVNAPQNFVNAISAKTLKSGTAITTTGANLNTYLTVGNYYCATNAVATTLKNIPSGLTGAFVMFVGYSTGTGYPYQEIIQYDTGVRFYRYNTSTTDTTKWKSWVMFDTVSKYLPLTGGTLTGALTVQSTITATGNKIVVGDANTAAIQARTPSRTGNILWAGGSKKAAGDGNGTVVGLGAGGLTLVGGGEYATNRYGVADLNDNAEQLYLGSDNEVYIETNGNTIANRKTWEFSVNGHFYMPTTINGASSPSATIDSGIFLSSYKGEDHSTRVLARQTTANRIAQLFEVGRYIKGSWKWNTFSVGIDANGDRTYGVTDPAAFRSALELNSFYNLTDATFASECKKGMPSGVTFTEEGIALGDTFVLYNFEMHVWHGNVVQLSMEIKYDKEISAGSSVNREITYGSGQGSYSNGKEIQLIGNILQPVVNAPIMGSPGTAAYGEFQKNGKLNLYFPKKVTAGGTIYLRTTFLNNKQIWPSTTLYSFAS